jgi:uncharacterized membrane protein YccC
MINHIQILQRFNAWRRSEEVIEQPHPKEIGEALDWLIEIHAELQSEIAELRAELDIAKAKENN